MQAHNKILLVCFDLNENEKIKEVLLSSASFFQVQECLFVDFNSSIIHNFPPDLIILSIDNNKIDIENKILEIKTQVKADFVPIIIITPQKNITLLNKAFNMGIWDYICLPVDKIELNVRIISALKISNTFKQKLKHKELIVKKSDELTIRNNELESLSQITSKLNHSLIIINAENKIEWLNEGVYKLYEIKEINISELLLLKIKQINSLFDESLKKCIESRTSITYQNFFNLKSYKKRFVQTNLYPVISDDKINKVIIIESDISLLKEKEDLLMTSREEFLYMIEDMDRVTVIFENQKKEFEKQKNELENEKKKSDELLYNILPVTIAEELKHFNRVEPKYYSNVSVMFADFQSFTKSCENLKFYELVKQLNTYFIKFDEIIGKYRIEKIKTIGDAYMCAGGVPVEDDTNPIEVILASLEIQQFVSKLNKENNEKGLPFWNLRLGIHTGPVYAGVVGKTKITYDIWGDTVNVASRMESGGEIGKVNISEVTYLQIKDYFDCTYRGEIEAKNKGKVKMYFVKRIKPEFAEDNYGLIPNKKLVRLLEKVL
jgi:class 3 adenylate cyclase/DNA-binding response OmpR family regulator